MEFWRGPVFRGKKNAARAILPECALMLEL